MENKGVDDSGYADNGPADGSVVDKKETTPEYLHLTVKDWDADRQPREKALKYGLQSLTKSELLALVLRVGLPGYPITQMCADILASNKDSLLMLGRRSHNELTLYRGVGTAMALQIQAIMELGKRMTLESIGDQPSIRSSADIYNMMRMQIGNLDHEEVHGVFLNRRNQVIKEIMVTSGTAVASLFDSKQFLREAILCGAQGVIMCHNHPSGNLTPSGSDDNITKQLKRACEAIDLHMLDHVIITTSGYYSYGDNGRL